MGVQLIGPKIIKEKATVDDLKEVEVPDSHWNSVSEHSGAGGFVHTSGVVQYSLSPIDEVQDWPPNWPNTSTLRERL